MAEYSYFFLIEVFPPLLKVAESSTSFGMHIHFIAARPLLSFVYETMLRTDGMSNNAWPSFGDVLNAYKECRLGKPANAQQTRFESRLGENLLLLTKEIQGRRYRPSRSTCFVVTHPKPREIFAAHFRDRIVHHLIVSRLSPIWEPRFSPSSHACRIDMGTHGALRDFKRLARSVSHGGLKNLYVLQLDIASFFVSIHRPILKSLMLSETRGTLAWLIEVLFESDARENVFKHSSQRLFDLIPREKSWFSRAPDEGIPIGNLTSQFGANLYLNELDHFIKRTLKAKAYIRYMDDLTFLDTDSEKLWGFVEPVNAWLKEKLKQCLNPHKTTLKSLKSGIHYLGYQIKQTATQSDPAKLLMSNKKKWEFISEVQELEKTGIDSLIFYRHPLSFLSSREAARKCLAPTNARIGMMRHAASFTLRKEALENLVKNLYPATTFPDNFVASKWTPLKLKKDYTSLKIR